MRPTVERAHLLPSGFCATPSSHRVSSSHVAPDALRSNSSEIRWAVCSSGTSRESSTPAARGRGVGSVKR